MKPKKKILLLHGSRQTGQLLLGRIDKLRKRLQKENVELVALDAPFPHPDDANMRQWWERSGNSYAGLEETMRVIEETWSTIVKSNGIVVGMIGFSQGARLAHLCALLHEAQPERYFPTLSFVILVANYDAPTPPELACMLSSNTEAELPKCMSLPSLHVFGLADRLIPPQQSRNVSRLYKNPTIHTHDGGHHVPMRAESVRVYVDFITNAVQPAADKGHEVSKVVILQSSPITTVQTPSEEDMQAQLDEVEALQAIFPDEFHMTNPSNQSLSYRIDLIPTDSGFWPPRPLALSIQYPYNYPSEVLPKIKLQHENNVMELSYAQEAQCMQAFMDAALACEGMPCVLSCVYAAREYFESGAMGEIASEEEETLMGQEAVDEAPAEASAIAAIPPASVERIRKCNLEGLHVATTLLTHQQTTAASTMSTGKGGSWTFTIGLVGKPSAGKSTFFNAATAFARQRDDSDNALGGATMAPHPFTTIDPNVGFCLVPAPAGSCPEESYLGQLAIGSTHGRDHLGRRLIPVLLKDVAGLVPGAYQGRGRGNKFLNDLTDADVLVHVLDASGTADTEGNTVGNEEDGSPSAGASHPLQDLAWIRNELIEWVYTNLLYKWDVIKRRGRSKLSDMFSGYGQTQTVTWNVLNAVERYMEESEQRDNALDKLEQWDAGDVHRLVSTFLGVRFPMALALNKCDLPTSPKHVQDIQSALPIDGAHVGIALSARMEMKFIKQNIEKALGVGDSDSNSEAKPPEGVWQCLQSAITLREPVLVFPVADFAHYSPLPGLTKLAVSDPSLPSKGMNGCLIAAGGSVPSLWNGEEYSCNKQDQNALRDVIIMKPGSTVEDVFLALKRIGALSGEFVRAEAAGDLGIQPKPIPKYQVVSRHCRILKIMTNKRTSWQNK